MAFPKRLLVDGEEVVVELRPHWAFLGWPLVAGAGVVVLVVGTLVVFSHAPVGVIYVLLAFVAIAGLWLAGRMLRWLTTSLVLTDSRIIERTGVLARSGLELRLERINQISYHQSLGARVFRSGEVLVEMGGETGVVVFDHVPRPAAVQRLITEQVAAIHRPTPAPMPMPVSTPGSGTWADQGSASSDTPPAGVTPVTRRPEGSSVADLLVQLDELHRRGILTDDEFRVKKAELIDRI